MTDQDVLDRAKEMAEKDDFPLIGFSHLEWWVGNAFQTAQFLRSQLGFGIVGYRGPETGTRETASYMLQQGDIRFIVTGAMGPDHPVTDHVLRHGPGVKDVAIAVPDANGAFEVAVRLLQTSVPDAGIRRSGSDHLGVAGLTPCSDPVSGAAGKVARFESVGGDGRQWLGGQRIEDVDPAVSIGVVKPWAAEIIATLLEDCFNFIGRQCRIG